MFNSKRVFFLFILGVGCVIAAVALYIIMNKEKSVVKVMTSQNKEKEPEQPEPSSVKNLPMQFCPKSEDLFRQDVYWATKDGKWKNYTPSSADKIINFIGAQWSGIHVGKIICLYQTNEAVSFPLAIEQVTSQGVNEPSGLGWSALANNFKLCKSASIADCGFHYEPPKDTGNVYEEIKYNPREDNLN